MDTQLFAEQSRNVLGTFASRDAAHDFVAWLLADTTDNLLDQITVSSERGHHLHGETLRRALEQRAQTYL